MRKPVKIAIYCICAILLAVSAYKIIEIIAEYNKASSAYNDTADMAVEAVVQSDTDIYPPINVDFDALYEESEYIIGWLYCEGTNINYPVVQSDDNNKFLRHLPDGTYNKAGSIFMDFQCAADCSDTNTILYGHNMKNGTMFAVLKNFKKQSFYDEHPVFWFLTPERAYRIDLVAGFTTSTGSDSYDMYTSKEDIQAYIERCIEKSDFASAVDPETVSHVMTLSTCSYEYDNARYVLVGSIIPCEYKEVSGTDE